MSRETNLTFIKESLHTIVNQLAITPKSKPSNDTKATAAKIYNLLMQPNVPTERFYFIYLTCQLCVNAKPAKVDKLMKLLLPSPPTAQSMVLISDLISFALCHPSVYTAILDNLSSYLNVPDSINLDLESWQQAESLAIDSPSSCSALLSRSDLAKMNIDKRLLAKWLQELAKSEQDFPPPSLNQLIRYSLFHHQPTASMTADEQRRLELTNSDLHLGILTLIQSKKCQTLTNQFLIDVVSTLAQQISPDQPHTTVVDRFAQILSVAAFVKVTTITNALRTSLSKLGSNQLIASMIHWQSK